jgi:hypothetical protein
MKGCLSLVGSTLTALSLGLMLLTPSGARADTTYKIQRVVQLGDTVAGLELLREGGSGHGGGFALGTLNDSGQLLFITWLKNPYSTTVLFLYDGGQIIPIVVAGGDAPEGTWDTAPLSTVSATSMNQHGNVAFTGVETIGGKTSAGTFRWEYPAQKITPVALKGMTVDNITFLNSDGGVTPIINNNDEIAFTVQIKNGALLHDGVVFLGRDGQMQWIARPDQVLPSGETIRDAYLADLNDMGAVAFFTVFPPSQGGVSNGYLWEKGTVTTLALAKQEIPEVGTIASVGSAYLNNQNHEVLVTLSLKGNPNNYGLYRFANGALTPLVVPGQDMPDGQKLVTIRSISSANKAGQRAFMSLLANKTLSAYLLDAAGSVSLILKTGAITDLGTITKIGDPSQGICLNSKGQVALAVAIDKAQESLVLLTPTAP